MEEPTDFDGIYAKVKAMRVSEIKAELDLRKISYVGLFEKEELARALAESRAEVAVVGPAMHAVSIVPLVLWSPQV